mmetsp:Transcript_2972/g.3512  ORF Transcript_2972/g.3512 Transcript_2972/m.3512 type:complete len:430 (+) Transcript_2972:27-1316(+)|eukprot:CAMPEP_0205825102 /NCGR_PEP_ID=MMETSP0206-20130828/23939_1 /ASSEMBLY_ACC=CAM_ASM_000279 /TAXON_ID=36767 /ORGANISM="Euplotes focardii, Strain TN1" /LENGTH=429 /DNA_ID=CAMNT_0053123847 /DNA_START=22 /DNA_END=1311 /DNA_ORIENTATION=+
MAEISEAQIQRLEKIAGQFAGVVEVDAAEVTAKWDEYYTTHVQPFIDTCNKYPKIAYCGEMAEKAFKRCGECMQAVPECKKPSQEDFMPWLQPIVDVITSSGEKCDNRSDEFPFQKSFAELAQVMQWLLLTPEAGGLPKTFVAGQLDAADFYLNKVLKIAKDQEEPIKTDYRNFVKQLKVVVKELCNYIQEFHKTGVCWNPRGVDFKGWAPGGGAAAAPAQLTLAERLEAVIGDLQKAADKAGSEEEKEPSAQSVVEWEEYYTTVVQPFVDSANMYPETKYIAEMTEKAWKHCGVTMQAATVTKKPSQEDFLAFLKPIVDVITGSNDKCDNRSDWFGHQKSFAELAACMQWLMMDLPTPFVKGQLDAADFYLNKVLKAAMADEAKKPNFRAFVKQLKLVVSGLADYCFKFHKTGVTWNGKGAALADFKA